MTTRPTLSIDARLNAMRLAVDNAQADSTIQTALAAYGYDQARIRAGKQLYDAAAALQNQQQAEYGEQYSATDAFRTAWEQAAAEYMRLVKVARVALKEQLGAWTTLGLVGDRKQTIAGWIRQARQFYDNALATPAVVSALATYGITEARLRAGQGQVAAVEAANEQQQRERGEAQQATEQRDAALDAMDDWYSDFIAIARVALDDQPQQLEKLGVVARSDRGDSAIAL